MIIDDQVAMPSHLQDRESASVTSAQFPEHRCHYYATPDALVYGPEVHSGCTEVHWPVAYLTSDEPETADSRIHSQRSNDLHAQFATRLC